MHHEVYFYRPQRSSGKVIFSEACVKNFVHGGGGMHGEGMCVAVGRGEACMVAWNSFGNKTILSERSQGNFILKMPIQCNVVFLLLITLFLLKIYLLFFARSLLIV